MSNDFEKLKNVNIGAKEINPDLKISFYQAYKNKSFVVHVMLINYYYRSLHFFAENSIANNKTMTLFNWKCF